MFLVNFHDNLDFGPIDENIIDLSNRNTGKADFVADFETIDIVKNDIELILPGRKTEYTQKGEHQRQDNKPSQRHGSNFYFVCGFHDFTPLLGSLQIGHCG